MREPVLHDYRKTYWGHNIGIKAVPNHPARFNGWCFARYGVRLMDEVIWETAYGYARARVVDCEPYGDPTDMYKIEVEVVGRAVKESLRKQFEEDNPFEVEEWIKDA